MISPPLLVSYSDIENYLKSLDETLLSECEQEIISLYEKGLPPVVSSKALAVLFGYSPKFIYSMSESGHKYYRRFVINKGKKKRIIEAPKVSLKVIQKWFGYHLSKFLRFDEHVYGYINRKSALHAASIHVNAMWMYSVDIIDFFPSVSKQLIHESLIDIGYSDNGATLLSKLMCYRDRLAQGSPASPVLSNLVMRQVDAKLQDIAKSNEIRLTRYADDIVYSGIDDFPENIVEEVRGVFEDTEWTLNESKEYLAKLPKRLKVHGLLVHGDRPRLTKGYRNKIRAYKHLMSNDKVAEKDKKRINGHLSYSNSVDEFNNK